MPKANDLIAVYRITHAPSGKTYIGSSINYRKRWCSHRCDLRANRHHSLLLQRAWNKYGASAFAFDVLEVVGDTSLLDAAELRWIEQLKPVYNASLSTNRHCLGRKNGPPSEETKQKIREKVTGFRHTEEAKSQMSAHQKGVPRTLTPDWREALRKEASLRFKGKILSEETRRKIAAANKGRTVSAATLAKKSAVLKGQPWSPARRAAYEAQTKNAEKHEEESPCPIDK